jgi:AraC-like DNA-binding protein
MKAKPIILILATLFIGFVLGMLTSAQIRYHKLNPVRVFFSEERFREGFYRAIQPDEQQKVKIDLVLDKYAKINSELQTNFRKEFDSSMKEFRKEIDTYLTKDQIARLKEMDERRQQMIRHSRSGHRNDSTGFRGERHHFHEGVPADGPDPSIPPPLRIENDSINSINNK